MKPIIIKKILAIQLSLLLAVNPLAVRLVLAEEAEGEPTETQVVQVETTPEPTGTPPAEETTDSGADVGGDAATATGDAAALSEVDTTANTNVDCMEGEVTVPEGNCDGLEVGVDCPGEEILNENEAEITATGSAGASTGSNQTTGSAGNATIGTGDAEAGVDMSNQANTNIVIIDDGDEAAVTEPDEAAGSQTGTDGCPGSDTTADLTVVNDNEAEADNTATASATTGDNQAAQNLGDVVISSGNALAWVNLLNFLNFNVVGSAFEVIFLDILTAQMQASGGNVNLNQVWQEMVERGSLGSVTQDDIDSLELAIFNFNQALLENNVTVNADSGNNTANENGSAELSSGDATALANVINFVNTNVVSSQFLFLVINVLEHFEGDLILPRLENFDTEFAGLVEGEGGGASATVTNQNQAEIDTQNQATATTGDNQLADNNGNQTVDTGDAQSAANSVTLANLNFWQNNWFFLIINNLSNWTGKIFGWSSPDSEKAGELGTQFYQYFGEGFDLAKAFGIDPSMLIFNDNQATIQNNVQVGANTGSNQANQNQGDASIFTGDATALSNIFNMANLNIFGGRWFFGVINILGDWTGDIIFAYPDVAVTLSNGTGQVAVGETTHYTLSYENQGYDSASQVWASLILPVGMRYLGDASGFTSQIEGQTCSWLVGDLEPGEGGSFVIDVVINSDFDLGEPSLSFLSKLVRPAYAAGEEDGVEVETTALVATNDPESDFNNNTASVTTLVYEREEIPVTESGENALPELVVTAWNNVNEFVYQGDTVTFEITVSNIGGGSAEDVYLGQQLYNGIPNKDFGSAWIPIGRLDAGEKIKVSFGMKLANGELLPAGHYHTISWAEGLDRNGDEVYSNDARTDFTIKSKVGSLLEVQAVDEEKKVLGASTEGSCEPSNEEILPYLLLFMLSSLWLVGRTRRLAANVKS